LRKARKDGAESSRPRNTGYTVKGAVLGMVSLQIPRAIFRTFRRGVAKAALSPFSMVGSATRRFVHLDNVDELQGVGDIVRRQGYPYEEIFVTTRDGYRISLERLPNPGSKKVLFMQHGVMDSSFTWVANGADASLAFQAHNEGYDVFLGNFRGAGGERAHQHLNPNITKDEYWNFSINEHAFEDIPACIQQIVRTKMGDLSSKSESDARPSIIAVAHSMGGAAMLMYAINQRENKLAHHLDGMVLVSPAGIHVQSPLYARVGGRAVDLTVAKMVHSLRLPTDALTRATVKLVQDIKTSVPALEEIISLILVYSLGGDRNQPRRGPFSAVQQLTYNVLTCGTSTKVYTHLRQFIATKRFQAFDYEPTAYPNHFHSEAGGNMRHYGTQEPPEYTSRYHLLDMPVHLIAGLGDKLIGPTNVLRHYECMKNNGVDVSIESIEHCGHADFTCGLHHMALNGILASVDNMHDKLIAKREALKELQKKKLITPHF